MIYKFNDKVLNTIYYFSFTELKFKNLSFEVKPTTPLNFPNN